MQSGYKNKAHSYVEDNQKTVNKGPHHLLSVFLSPFNQSLAY